MRVHPADEQRIFRLNGAIRQSTSPSSSLLVSSLKPHSFDFPLLYALLAPVVGPHGPRVGMRGDLLGRLREGCLLLVSDAGYADVLVHSLPELVVGGHPVALPALLAEMEDLLPRAGPSLCTQPVVLDSVY